MRIILTGVFVNVQVLAKKFYTDVLDLTSKKWVSMSSNGNLTLSDDLLKMPTKLVYSIIVQELLHLKVADHGRGRVWLPAELGFCLGEFLPGLYKRQE